MPRDHIHFVTGKLAEYALRETAAAVAAVNGFDYSISVLPITVAALMTPAWIARHLAVPETATRVMVTGYCPGDLLPIEQAVGRPVERGPRDLRNLPEYFGQPRPSQQPDYGAYDIEILAEINHAPQLPLPVILAEAAKLQADGADLIDLGCDPGRTWTGVADAVRALRDAGHRVSIDSFNVAEVADAVRAGAELVLSVHHENRAAAADWGVEVVAIPDCPGTLDGLEATIEHLDRAGIKHRLDPILEPIGHGFAASLARYMEVRRRWPQAEMLMGIGNLTELTDADSAGINVLLLAICQELGVRSVLTTQVINWARTSVRECDLARRLVHYAVTRRALPKHVEPNLVLLRDPKPLVHGHEALERLAQEIRDPNYRLFAEAGQLHAVTAGVHFADADPFRLFERLLAAAPDRIDASHAFYLGYELAKAVTALTLGKDYRQDEALDWGFLTIPEEHRR